ncbi:cytochrome P450 2H1-like [Haliotis cracherodii]|uniref:cytochrome P450 2H1-like n=1 Tax=Haliotis cracherodii TaxID=6455 RepID=UPI0039E897F3
MKMAIVLLEFIDLQTLLVSLVVLAVSYYLFCSSSHELPPGPRAWPVIGNLLDIGKHGRTKVHLYYAEMQKKYGNVYRIYFGSSMMTVVNGYGPVHEVLVKQGGLFSYRPIWLYGPQQATKKGRGIIWGDGEEWRQLRRMTLRALRDLGVGKSPLEERITEEIHCLKEVLTDLDGQPVQIRKNLTRSVANVIYSVLFGSRFEYDDPTFKSLIDATDNLFRTQGARAAINAIPSIRFLPFFGKLLQPYIEGSNKISAYADSRIEEHRQTYQEGVERDYVDTFLKYEAENPDSTVYTAGNMTRCIMDLILAGTETTSATLDFGILYMIKYPDVQHKCQREIDRVVGCGRTVQVSDRPSLIYTEATLMEIQRMSSIASAAVLRTSPWDTWVGGYRIPRNTLVYTSIYSVLHDPELWGDPHIFKPERFITPEREIIYPGPWIPFGGGPRMCAGEILARMELFLFFSNLLQSFHFSKVGNIDPDIDPEFGMTMTPKPYEVEVLTRL